MEDVDKMFMKRIHISDYYDDDNDGYVYGVHFYDEQHDDLGEMMAVDAEWFKTEAEREASIEAWIKDYGFEDID